MFKDTVSYCCPKTLEEARESESISIEVLAEIEQIIIQIGCFTMSEIKYQCHESDYEGIYTESELLQMWDNEIDK